MEDHSGPVPIQNRKLLICSCNPGLGNQQRNGTRYADHTPLLNRPDIRLYLWIDGSKANSWLVEPKDKWRNKRKDDNNEYCM